MVLSMPATVALIGLCLALLLVASQLTMPALLMVFPAWVGLACASYVLPTARAAAAVLCGITGLGFGLISLKLLGIAGV
jgi:cell shape-determining protein MreD